MLSENTDSLERVGVEVELANGRDITSAKLGLIPPSAIRRLRIRGIATRKTMRLVLPASVAEPLGLELSGTTVVHYPDGRTTERPMAQNVQLSYAGRHGVYNAIVDPDRECPLIGFIVLDDLDLLIDSTTQRLVRRDPRQVVSET